jgi:hypothetical protein
MKTATQYAIDRIRQLAPPNGDQRMNLETRPGLMEQPTLVPGGVGNPLQLDIARWLLDGNQSEIEKATLPDWMQSFAPEFQFPLASVRGNISPVGAFEAGAGGPPIAQRPAPTDAESLGTVLSMIPPFSIPIAFDNAQRAETGAGSLAEMLMGTADAGLTALSVRPFVQGARAVGDFDIWGKFFGDEGGSLRGTGLDAPVPPRTNGGPPLDPEVAARVEAQIANYPAAEGWAQDLMDVQRVDKGKPVYREVAYGFEKPPEGVSPEDWQSTIVEREVDEVRNLVDRVRAGDPDAAEILNQANWYRTMRTTLRNEFGGMGDVFADILGATSAQTGVEMNWNNAIEIMRRFSRGEYDEEMRLYQEMLDAGNVNPTRLQQLHNDPNNPFRLITSAAGSLFNTNSPAATKALFDMFRTAKGAPKTPNFTGNLIGYTDQATIDVWAARHLRRLAGMDRLPPLVEKGVTGNHRKGSTLENPNVGGEFGFGQKVLRDAADRINEEGIIRSVAPHLEDMTPADLQAVAWFIEKERWTDGGWTTKAGEGGSFELEASFAGAADPAAVKSLRREINKSFTPPNRLATDTDATYAARVDAARADYDARQAQAQAELDQIKAPLARYVLGISVERPGLRPTNAQQAEISGLLGAPAANDPSVVMYQVNNTYGRFMQSDERAFNAEFVVRENFDPTDVTRRMVEVAKDADQDAAFISKVVPNVTPDSRPGVEVYFRNRQGPEFARELSDKLTEYGVDGFTFITDSRVMDRAGAQAGQAEEAVAGLNGLRFQYIPEFDMGRDAWLAMKPSERQARLDEMRELYEQIARGIDDPSVSTVNLMEYETNVIERGDYDEYLK